MPQMGKMHENLVALANGTPGLLACSPRGPGFSPATPTKHPTSVLGLF